MHFDDERVLKDVKYFLAAMEPIKYASRTCESWRMTNYGNVKRLQKRLGSGVSSKKFRKGNCRAIRNNVEKHVQRE
jgi:hypothetical protein